MMAKRTRAKPAAGEPWLLEIQFKRLEDLHHDPDNARTHSASQVAIIEASLVERGWYQPLAEAANVVRIGNGRLTAARNLYGRGIIIEGAPEGHAPVVDVTRLTPAQLRALALADNRIAELAGWDMGLVAEQIGALAAADFDLGSIGFSLDDIATLADATDAPKVVETPVSQVEDRFWLSVRGPLQAQAQALQALRRVMGEIEGLAVEIGTVLVDDG